jgi:hypothetical protein
MVGGRRPEVRVKRLVDSWVRLARMLEPLVRSAFEELGAFLGGCEIVDASRPSARAAP